MYWWKNGPVAPSARNHAADNAGTAALSWPAPNSCPPAFVYIARSTTISAAGLPPEGRLSITAENVVVGRVGKSIDTLTVRRLRGRRGTVSALVAPSAK